LRQQASGIDDSCSRGYERAETDSSTRDGTLDVGREKGVSQTCTVSNGVSVVERVNLAFLPESIDAELRRGALLHPLSVGYSENRLIVADTHFTPLIGFSSDG